MSENRNAIIVDGDVFPSQKAYVESVKGTDRAVSNTELKRRLDSDEYPDYIFAHPSRKVPHKTIQFKMTEDKRELFLMALEVMGADKDAYLEQCAKQAVMNAITIIRDHDTDLSHMYGNLEKQFRDAWKPRPGTKVNILEEVA